MRVGFLAAGVLQGLSTMPAELHQACGKRDCVQVLPDAEFGQIGLSYRRWLEYS